METPAAVNSEHEAQVVETKNNTVDLESFYKTELTQFKDSQAKKDGLTLLRERLPEGTRRINFLERNGLGLRVPNFLDKIRHTKLQFEARLRGVQNIDAFQNLVDYFESTLTEYSTKNGKSYYKKFNITGKHIPVLQELLSINSNPANTLQTLREAGLFFTPHNINPTSLESPESSFRQDFEKIKMLLKAPYLDDAMSVIKGISSWNGNWFSNAWNSETGKYDLYPDEIDVIIQMAQSPGTKDLFTPEVIDKIDVLSRAMNIKVKPSDLNKYIELINNSQQFDFVLSCLNSNQGHILSMGGKDVFDNLTVLEKTNLLDPLTVLTRNGLIIDENIFKAKYPNPNKTFDEILQGLQDEISKPFVQQYLQDPKKQEFVQLLSHLTGTPNGTNQLETTLSYFDNKEQTVYLYKLVYGDRKVEIGNIGAILKDQDKTQVLISHGFKNFFDSLKSDNFQIEPEDFFDKNGSRLYDAFLLKDIITLIGANSVQNFLKLARANQHHKDEYFYIKNRNNSLEVLSFLRKYSLMPPLVDIKSGLPDFVLLGQIIDTPLPPQEIIDSIPESARKMWLTNMITLPQFAREAIYRKINENGGTNAEVLNKPSELVAIFKAVDLKFNSYSTQSANIKRMIADYQGNAADLINNGEPTYLMARQFINIGDYDTLHAILTDSVLNGFEQLPREALNTWKELPGNIRMLIALNTRGFPDVTLERLTSYQKTNELVQIIRNSRSKEIKRLETEIVQLLWQTENPRDYLDQIMAVFEGNNLPTVGKVFRVFEILYPPDKFEQKLREGSNLSPVLVNAEKGKRYDIVYQDLLKVAIESGNPSLYNFLIMLQDGQQIIDEAETYGTASFEGRVTPEKREQAVKFLNRLDVLYANSRYGRRKGQGATFGLQLEERIAEIRNNLGVRNNQKLIDRVSAMFLRPLGFKTIQEVLDRMKSAKIEAELRNIRFAEDALKSNSGITIHEGDLLKGIGPEFLGNILLNGVLAREYLGASADSDMTPFDTDVTIITDDEEKQTLATVIANSKSSGFGELMLCLRNRGQFQNSRAEQNPDKYELFYSGAVSPNHYGIRTGIASTEIDVIIAKDSLARNEPAMQRIYFTIAQNGFYIPIVNKTGEIIFTPQMYEEYKVKNEEVRNILNKIDFSPLELIDTLKQSPFMRHLYESSVGVWEGYTLNQHTLMAMGQYEKYFADRWRSPLISQEGFRMMLSLHDLGKPLSVQIAKTTAEQHEYTMKFLPGIIQGVGFKPQEAEVMTAIANQDFLGAYLQGHLTAENTAKSIRGIAQDLGVPASQLFELLKMYFMCDAGAYTEDAGGSASLDRLFVFKNPNANLPGQVTLSSDTQTKVDEIEKLLQAA